jgi:hypothetical protein
MISYIYHRQEGVPTFCYQVSLDTGKTLFSLVYFNYLLYMTPQIVCEKYVQLIVWHRPGFDLGPPLSQDSSSNIK